MNDESDVTIAEIRQVRHGISERLGHDPQQVIAYYIELQRQYAGRCLPAEDEELPEEPLFLSEPPNIRTPLTHSLRSRQAVPNHVS
jgi:hypothetical protein